MPAPTEVVERSRPRCRARRARGRSPCGPRRGTRRSRSPRSSAGGCRGRAGRGGRFSLPEVGAARTGGRRRRSLLRLLPPWVQRPCGQRAGQGHDSYRLSGLRSRACRLPTPNGRTGPMPRTSPRGARGSTGARNQRRSTPSSPMYACSQSSTRPRPCGGGSPGSPRPTGPRAWRRRSTTACGSRSRRPRGRTGGGGATPSRSTSRALRRMSAALPRTRAGARDRAILLLGYGAALRRTELVDLDVADVQVEPGVGLAVALPRGRIVVPPGSVPLTCAVKAWTAWLQRVRAAGRPRVPPGGSARQRAPAAVVGPRGHARRAARGRRCRSRRDALHRPFAATGHDPRRGRAGCFRRRDHGADRAPQPPARAGVPAGWLRSRSVTRAANDKSRTCVSSASAWPTVRSPRT